MPIFYENYYKEYLNIRGIRCVPFSVPTPNGDINLYLPLIYDEFLCDIDVRSIENIYDIVLQDAWVCLYYEDVFRGGAGYVRFELNPDTSGVYPMLTATPRFFIPKSFFTNGNDPVVKKFSYQFVEVLKPVIEFCGGKTPKDKTIDPISMVSLIKFGK